MCIVIVCFPGCHVINFEINLIFLKRPLHEKIFMNDFTRICHSFYILSSLRLKNIERTDPRRIYAGSFNVLFNTLIIFKVFNHI